MRFTYMDSPAGPVLLAADDEFLRVVEFDNGRDQARPEWTRGTNALIDRTRAQLAEYFAGQRRSFDLPFASNGTPFQERVWRTLLEIPYGQTWSYRDLATRIGKPTATRAVGAANGRNPLSILRPCHRVIGADGSLTGYGGGLPAKRWLLQLEGVLPRA